MASALSFRNPYFAHRKRKGVLLCALLSVTSCLAAQGSKGYLINSEEHNGQASRRLALVIGNKDYPWKPLTNPVNDATDVAAALELAGFKGNVQRIFNTPHDTMKRAVRDFVASVHPGDFAFVYYSGHGVEIKGINYLLPIDIPANATADQVEDDAVSAQRIASDLGDHGAAIKVIVLDACRDTPISASRSAAGGLAAMEGLGSLIVFATEAGRTASDNSASRNGLFTQYLLKALSARGVSLDDAVRDVSRQMAQDTNRQQVPAIYGLLEREVYLFTGPVTLNVAPAPLPPDPALEAWERIRDSKDPLDFDDFVSAFPQSPYVPTAHLAANRLRRETSAATHTNSEPSRPIGSDGSFTLVVSCDLECTWKINGEEKGTIQPGAGDLANVPPGDYVLSATSTDGRAHTSKNVSGKAGASKIVSFSLKPLADSPSAILKAVADRGLSEYNQKNYAGAETDFTSACSQGDLHSCRYLAYMYEVPVGVPQDIQKAVSLYQTSCDEGELTSCHNLADMYQAGKSVAQDYQKAFALFQRACTDTEVHGCDGLGFMYTNGVGVTKDLQKAVGYFNKVCDGGILQGCSNLASMYLSAEGVSQDDARALSLFKTACDGKIPSGCDGLAYMYRYGRAVTVDLEKAHTLYDQACNLGFDTSCKTLAAINAAAANTKLANSSPQSDTGNSPAIKTLAGQGLAHFNQKDYIHAEAEFQSACSQGDNPSCSYLGYMYEFAVGVPQDYPRALPLLQSSCDAGQLASCHNLADMYEFGRGVAMDYQKAFSLFQRACTGGEAHGCEGLGYMYMSGTGVTKDLPRAVELFKNGCDGGELQGCSNLAAMYLSGLGVPQDDQKAVTLFKSACDGNTPAGCDGLAYMYRFGRGVPIDLDKAHSLYQQACDARFDSSCKTLESFTGK
jgi:hypothetical protein